MATKYDITTINDDTFNGVQFTISVNGDLLDLTNYSIKMQARARYNLPPIFTIYDGSGITITDAVNGVFRIDPQIFHGVPGVYQYDIQLTSQDGIVKTYISGLFTLLEDITQ
jgi:hypothetical protein